jgi:hypothetical protein
MYEEGKNGEASKRSRLAGFGLTTSWLDSGAQLKRRIVSPTSKRNKGSYVEHCS